MRLATRCSLLTTLLLTTFQVGATSPNATSYNVLVLMDEKSPTNRFVLDHIGPAIDIAQKVHNLCL